MKLVLRNALAVAAVASALALSVAGGPAQAATPKDMFVMAICCGACTASANRPWCWSATTSR
ncbi:hypothetical protein PQR75_31330 [Paraburkholderia fungorum]|uniref:hypothetical protein n=1 Tax=Paraburkholderia fungorum TaxID=134537 RepID=UPI0038BAC0EF